MFMKPLHLIAAMLCCFRLADAASNREVFSNSVVYLSYTVGTNSSSGSGFIMVRPTDSSKVDGGSVEGQAFLVTNKHVIPPEGKESKLAMRVTIADANGALATKTIDLPMVGADGKYFGTVRRHPNKDVDVAAINVTREVAQNKMRLEFVFTTLLGTKERLKKQMDAALVGDDIYMLGYPAGLFDTRNANPIWRIGIIATSPLLGYAFPELLQKNFGLPTYVDGFLIDAQVYPGSSGAWL